MYCTTNKSRETLTCRCTKRNKETSLLASPLLFINSTRPPFNHPRICQYDWLVVSTHLKNISQNGSFPQIGMKINHLWNHHLDEYLSMSLSHPESNRAIIRRNPLSQIYIHPRNWTVWKIPNTRAWPMLWKKCISGFKDGYVWFLCEISEGLQ